MNFSFMILLVLNILLASFQVWCYCVSRCFREFEACSWYFLSCIKDFECAAQWGILWDSADLLSLETCFPNNYFYWLQTWVVLNLWLSLVVFFLLNSLENKISRHGEVERSLLGTLAHYLESTWIVCCFSQIMIFLNIT